MKVAIAIFVVLLYHAQANPIVRDEVKKDYRLDGKFEVESYNLTLIVNEIAVDKNYTGTVVIKLKAISSTKSIKLHIGEEITVNTNKVKVTIKKNNKDTDIYNIYNKDGTSFAHDETDIVEVKLAEEVKQGDEITLTFTNYTAKFSSDMYGFYISSYKEGKNTLYLATTQFQPTHARRVFPCLDEPKYKATFTITINHPDGYTAISNQPEETKTNVKTVFKPTAKMSTYLVAFVVSKFQKKEVVFEGSKKSNIWTPSELLSTAEYAANVTPPILNGLNQFTGINYWSNGMEKLDQVAIPDFSAGAMENWGLVTYRETALLIDKDKSTERNRQRVSSVIAHEFAHMWFGNLVTLDWWDNTWLNEGFARYFEYFIIDLVEDKWKMEEQFVAEQVHSALVVDGFNKSKALNYNISTQAEIKAKFDSISYNKGAAIIRMMEEILGGRKNCTEGLKKYLGDNKFKNVKPENLMAAFINKNGKIGDIMKAWIEKPGYPLVTIKRNDNDTITVKQERFLYEQTQEPDDKYQPWYIRLKYSTKKNKFDTLKDFNTQNWTSEKNYTFKDFDLFILNEKQNGYYRVKYEGSLLSDLQKVLKTNASLVPVINKAQIVDDYMNLARAGRVDYSTAFETIDFLRNETEYLPWYAALNSFSFLRRRFADGSNRNSIDNQLKGLMKKVTESVDFNDKTEHMDVLKQVLILQWACEVKHEGCVKNATDLFRMYVEAENKTTTTKATFKLNPNLKSIVLCAGLRQNVNQTANWELIHGLLQKSSFPQEQATFITALGCTTNETQLEVYLNKTINSEEFRKQDRMSVFNAVLTGNTVGVKVAFKFLKEQHEKIEKNYQGLNALTEMLNNVAERLTDTTQMGEFVAALDTFKTVPQSARDAVKEVVNTNKEWIQKTSDSLTDYFKGDDDDGGAANLTIPTLFLLLSTLFLIKHF